MQYPVPTCHVAELHEGGRGQQLLLVQRRGLLRRLQERRVPVADVLGQRGAPLAPAADATAGGGAAADALVGEKRGGLVETRKYSIRKLWFSLVSTYIFLINVSCNSASSVTLKKCV